MTWGRIDTGTFHGEHCLVGLCSFFMMLEEKACSLTKVATYVLSVSLQDRECQVENSCRPTPGVGNWNFSGKEPEIPGVPGLFDKSLGNDADGRGNAVDIRGISGYRGEAPSMS